MSNICAGWGRPQGSTHQGLRQPSLWEALGRSHTLLGADSTIDVSMDIVSVHVNLLLNSLTVQTGGAMVVIKWLKDDEVFTFRGKDPKSSPPMKSNTWIDRSSVLECPELLKCHPMSSFMSYLFMVPKWALNLSTRAPSTWPAYCFLHFLQEIQYSGLILLQVSFHFVQ